jgi:serine/threonine-protein kinase
MSSLPPGQVLDGKFRIVVQIAEGGLGHIFEAEHLGSGKRVAVEVAPPDLGKNADSLGRFLQEVKAASGLNQEHISVITDMGRTPGGGPFLVASEPYRGQTLEARLAALGGRMPLSRAAHIVRQILEALGPAHRGGLIHRGLGLKSIFLTHRGTDPDFVKVLDFGWHRVLGDDAVARQALAPLGVEAPYFWSPEQARRTPLDHRSDIFAVGALLYRLVTGQVPFPGNDAATILAAIASGRYVPPRTVNPEVPPPLEQILQYALALDAQYRYQTAEHLAQMLAPMAQRIQAPPPPDPQPAAGAPPPPPGMGGGGTAIEPDELPRRGRGKALPLIVGGVVAAVVFGILMGVRGRPRAATVEPPKSPTTEEKPTKPDKPVKEDKAVVVTPPPKKDVVPDAAPVAKAVVPDAAPVAKAAVPDAAPVAKMAALTFAITPPEAADVARISVNGKPIEGNTLEIEKTDQIKVDVRASGYQNYSKKVLVPADGQITIDLKKTVTKGPRRPKAIL